PHPPSSLSLSNYNPYHYLVILLLVPAKQKDSRKAKRRKQNHFQVPLHNFPIKTKKGYPYFINLSDQPSPGAWTQSSTADTNSHSFGLSQPNLVCPPTSHGMFRLLPWPAPIGGNKVMAEEVKMLAPAGCAPGMNMNVNMNVNALSQALPPLLKRKRSDSAATDAPASTKPRSEPAVAAPTLSTPTLTVVPASNPVAAPVAPSLSSVTTASEPAPAPAPTAPVRPDVNRLRDTITAQLSLEVLLKHNELRLIDQEIAKCQVALEQLRRCAEIPYPGSAVSGMSANVSAGTGASVLQPGNGPAPISPAPWGVTEGPYSRHYARWLLPDPRFDGGEVETGSLAVRDGFLVPEGRSTRGNPMDFSSLAGKTRPSRGTPQAKFQSLSSGYPVPKEKPGPMLIRRKSDQVLVKLVCLDCRRDNFSSTQGFINHCRIAHNRNFASHDAAAMASGEPVEVDDAGTIIGGPAPRSESTSSVPTTGLVHSLNRSTQLPTPSKESVTPQKPTLVKLPNAVATPPATIQPKAEPAKALRNPSFLASPATPHLSALMRDRGLGLNLDKLVAEAKTPVDLSAFSDDDSDADESSHQSSQPPSQQGIPVARQPMRMPTAQAALQRSESRKGIDRGPHDLPDMTPSRPPYQQSFLDLSSLDGGHHHSLTDASRESDSLDHSANLSPNALESNQAPSLVSDDEDDYEAASDSDSPSSSEADEEEQEFRHIEVEDDERAGAPSAATAEPKPGPSLTNPGPQAAPTLSNPLKQSRSKKMSLPPTFADRRRDDPQVNFMHPSKEEAQLKLGEDLFHPRHMTLSTFRRLLSCYPTTVEQVHRRKAMLKLQPKPEKGSKRKGEKKTGSTSANLRDAMALQKTEFSASEQKYINEETDKFLTLDKWRYEDMPKVMGERRVKKKGEVLTKDDLITVMEWKMKHGISRPMLMGMVKSNQDKNVIQCSSTAMAALSTEDPMLAPDEAFPKPSIDAFGPVRGVGVATASLILSIATATGDPKQQVPFYSDDVYLWLCLEDFPKPEEYEELVEEDTADQANADAEAISKDNNKHPHPPKSKLKRRISKFKRPNGELNVKYNIAEYRKLWEACWELCERLNRAAETESSTASTPPSPISLIDIEKVALVLRNIDVSGFLEGQESEDTLRTAAQQKARGDAAMKAEQERIDPSGETAAQAKRITMKKEQKEQIEEKASPRERENNNGGRNIKRRKIE
ncbi:hypothetical protein F1880_002143, partial [Penicillium rolfsii]